MKRKKRKTRFIAVLAAVMMVFIQMAPVSFAEKDTDVQTGSAQQIKPNGAGWQTAENGAVKYQKAIAGTDTENVFDVTLKVETTQNLEIFSKSPNAAVVLVIDNSTSMKGDKLSSAKSAANKFVEAFKSDQAERYISVVNFATNAEKKCGFININQNMNGVKSAINNLKADGYTNIEGGLQLAHNIIQAEKEQALKGVDDINIILLSDGEPNRIIKEEDRTKTDKITGIKPDGENSSEKAARAASAVAGTIKNAGTKLFCIGFTTGSSQNQFLADISSNGKVYTSQNQDELIKNFEEILEFIKLGADAWKITDPMGSFIMKDKANIELLDGNGKNVAQVKDGTIDWNLKATIPQERKEGENTIFSYMLKYRIALDTTDRAGFPFGTYTKANGITELTYLMYEEKGDAVTEKDLKTVSFKVPEVKGLAGAFSFCKKDSSDGAALKDAEFQLKGTATGSKKTVKIDKVRSDKDGVVTFDKIPAGEYQLIETAAPEGYEKTDQSHAVKVSYGTVTIDGLPAEQLSTVTNKPVPVKVELTKKMILKTDAAKLGDIADNLTFTFDLYKNKGTAASPEPAGSPIDTVSIQAKELKAAAGNSVSVAFNKDVTKGEYVITERTLDSLQEGWAYDTQTVAVSVAKGKASYQYQTKSKAFENKFYGVKHVTVTKNWKTGEFQPKDWPDSITVQLWQQVKGDPSSLKKAGGTKVIKPDAAGSWSAEWENLPAYDITTEKEFLYTAEEVKVGAADVVNNHAGDYTVTYNENKQTITNTYSKSGPTPEISKKIQIAGEEAGAVPSDFSFHFVLYKDKDEIGTASVNSRTAEVNGTYGPVQFVDSDHKPVKLAKGTYRIEESSAAGWATEAPITVNVDQHGEITYNNKKSVTAVNTWLGLGDVTAEKIWSDGNDQDKARPSSITLALKKDGTLIEGSKQEITVDRSKNKDTAVWKDLPIYNPDKTKIHYTVVEFNNDQEVTDRYNDKYTAVYNGLTVTNTHETEKTVIKGIKTWKDGDNQFKTRPDSVEVTLFADGAATDQKQTVTEKNQWAYEFKDLPVYNDGVKIDYSVRETKIGGQPVEKENGKETAAGYVVTYDGNHITNALDDYEAYSWDGTIKVTKKVVADGQPQKVTDTFYVALFSDKDCTKRAQMPDPDPQGQGGDMDIPVQKIELKGSDTGTAEFKGIPVGTTDKAVTYYLAEVADESGQLLDDDYAYRVSVQVNGKTGNQIDLTVKDHEEKAELTNTFTNQTSVEGAKTWANDQFVADLFRPSSITVKLLQNGKEYQRKEVKADTDGNWTYTFDKLPKFNQEGNLYQYTIDEETVDGYEGITDGMDLINTLQGYLAGSVSITKKVTLDGDPYNVAGVFYAGIFTDPECKEILTINQDGREVPAIAALPVDGTESPAVTVDGLPLGAGGEPTKYYIAETDSQGKAIAAGNEFTIGVDKPEVTVDAHGTKAVTITNNYAQKAALTGTKTWNDDNNAENTRPASIKVTLLQNGKVYKDPITDSALVKTITAKDNWSYSFVNLPETDRSGKAYEYSVMETGAEADYTSEVNGMNLTNTLNVEQYYYQGTIDITKKTMLRDKAYKVDDVYYAGIFTDSSYSTLLTDENGEDIIYAIALDNQSQASIQVPVPAGANGEAVTYYVTEVDEYGTPVGQSGGQQFTCDVKGGVCSVKGGDTGKVTFTNTYQVKKVPQTGDSDSGMLWLLLMLTLAAIAMVYAVIQRKKA